MKQSFGFILVLIFSFSGFSQKKIKKIEQDTISNVQDVYVVDAIVGPDIDTLRIPMGKPCLVIFDVSEYSNESYCFNEEKEIIKNFGKDALRVIKVYGYTYIIFGNKQIVNVSLTKNSYQGFAYWGGTLKDKVQLQDGTYYATEFLAKHIGVDKKSSYVVNAPKYKKEVAVLSKADNITENSKVVMNAFLNYLKTPMPFSKEEDLPLFIKTIESLKAVENLKNIEIYFKDNKGKKRVIKNIVFNKNQQLILLTNYDDEGIAMQGTNYIYKNGILVKIINGESSAVVSYDDTKMIFSSDLGGANEVRITWIENNVLLEKAYALMVNEGYPYMNIFSEEKLENNCITKYIDNNVWTINCNNDNIFPFINSYTSFQNDEVMQYRKTKLVKKGDKLFEKYYSTAKKEGAKDDFKLCSVFHFNDQNLLSSYELIEDNVTSNIKIEYTYFPKN